MSVFLFDEKTSIIIIISKALDYESFKDSQLPNSSWYDCEGKFLSLSFISY